MYKLVAKTIFDNIFGRNFRLVVGDFEEFKKLLIKEIDFDIGSSNGANGKYYDIENTKTGKSYVYVWLEKFDNSPVSIGILAHELHHHQYYLSKDLNINDKEALAYFFEYCLRESLKFLNEKDGRRRKTN